MADGYDRLRLLADLVHGQHAPRRLGVLTPEAAVGAGVDAEVPTVKRCEGHDARTVHPHFDFQAGPIHLFPKLQVGDVQQGRGLGGLEPFQSQRLVENLPDAGGLGIPVFGELPRDLRVVNEVLSMLQIARDLFFFNDVTALFAQGFCFHVISPPGAGRAGLP